MTVDESEWIARELRRRYLITLHVLVYGLAACPVSGCAQCARLSAMENDA